MAVSESTPLLNESPNGPVIQDDRVSTPLNTPIESTRTELFWTFLALWSAVFLSALDNTIVATLISPIGSYFNASHQASYLGTSYLLSMCCFTPLYGRLADILGRKQAMLVAVTLFGVGTLICGLANSMTTLITARAIAGMGGGGIHTVSSIALSDLVPLKQRGVYIGFSSVLFALGNGLGGPVGGLANDWFGWRWGFLAQMPILALASMLIIVKAKLPYTIKPATLRQKLARIDWLGSITLVGFVGSFLVAMTLKTAEEMPWSAPEVWVLFTVSALSSVAFLLVEVFVSPEPILPLSLLLRRTSLSASIANFAAGFVGVAILYTVPLYFEAVKLQTPSKSGAHLLPNAIFIVFGSMFAGWVMKTTGKYWLLIAASSSSLLLSCLLFAGWNDDTTAFELWFDIVPFGFGISSFFTSSLIGLISSVSQQEVAVITGICYLFRTTGQVIGVGLSGALGQSILRAQLSTKIHTPDAAEVIDKIRHSTDIIRTLEPEIQQAAVASWKVALRAVFILNAAFAFITLLASIPMEEFELPSTFAEPAKLSPPQLAQVEEGFQT
ncbi:vacuolar amino acid permease [Clavulina sp. PMI_390]|nr:vacuolar amino acid permease [Clavulina sp. PMI_390]